ncbi:MAG: hypothetical protein AB8G14_15900 [Ilumatobacter sp.]
MPGQPLVWSANGEYAAWLTDRIVRIWERSTGTISTVERLGAVAAIAAAPDGFAPDDAN